MPEVIALGLYFNFPLLYILKFSNVIELSYSARLEILFSLFIKIEVPFILYFLYGKLIIESFKRF